MKKKVNKIAPKCPQCGKTITSLNNLQSAYITYTMNKHGDYSPNPIDIDCDNNVNEWNCPECGHSISDCEDDAINFLMGLGC